MRTCLLLTATALLLTGCQTSEPQPVQKSYDFADGADGWTADISDYSDGQLDTLEFESGIRDLPDELGEGTGYYVKSMNRSDDAFMFIKRKLTIADGIVAGATYRIAYEIHIGSSLPSGCAGIGGAPESSFFKAGGSTEEPKPELDEAQDFVDLTVDKGQQSTGGPAASIVGEDGDITNGTTECTGDIPFVDIERTHTHTTNVTADDAGNLWLLMGTDSGYEGLTALYYLTVDVTLTPVAAE